MSDYYEMKIADVEEIISNIEIDVKYLKDLMSIKEGYIANLESIINGKSITVKEEPEDKEGLSVCCGAEENDLGLCSICLEHC